MVIFGGRLTNGTYTNVVQAYYPATNTTEVFTSDAYPETSGPGGVAVVDNKAYVFGGFDGATVLDDTHIFNIKATPGTCWSTGPSLLRARGFIGTAVVDDVIYAIGGVDYPSSLMTPLAITEKLDTEESVLAWDDLGVTDLPLACDEMRAFGFDTNFSHSIAGKIVIGGYGQWPNETADGLSYDVATDTWDVTFPKLIDARRNYAGVVIPEGSGTGCPGIWLWGGRLGSDANILAKVEYYPF